MSVQLDVGVGSLPPFDPRVDPHNLSEKWKKWVRAFKLYVLGKGVTDEKQKQAHGSDIYYTLVTETEEKDYDGTLKELNDHFMPKAHTSFERQQFRKVEKPLISMCAG